MLSPLKSLKNFINGVDEDELEAEEEYKREREEAQFNEYSNDDSNPFKKSARTIPVDFPKEVEERTGTKIETPLVNPYQKPSRVNIVIVEPRQYDDAAKLVAKLKSNEPVLVNLEAIDTENGKRIFDFLCGAVIALDGSIKKVSSQIYLFSPNDVRVTSFNREIVSE